MHDHSFCPSELRMYSHLQSLFDTNCDVYSYADDTLLFKNIPENEYPILDSIKEITKDNGNILHMPIHTYLYISQVSPFVPCGAFLCDSL